RGPVVLWCILECSRLLVVFGPVLAQGFQPELALVLVDPDARETDANRVDAVDELVVRNEARLSAQRDQRLDTCTARADVAHPGIVRNEVFFVVVTKRLQLGSVMSEVVPMVLVAVAGA